MTVQKLIDILLGEVKEADRNAANIEFYLEGDHDQRYDIKEMSGFSLSPDIVITLMKVDTPMMAPATFKAEHKKMVKETLKKIKKDTKKVTKKSNKKKK
jgi:hypothetical protein